MLQIGLCGCAFFVLQVRARVYSAASKCSETIHNGARTQRRIRERERKILPKTADTTLHIPKCHRPSYQRISRSYTHIYTHTHARDMYTITAAASAEDRCVGRPTVPRARSLSLARSFPGFIARGYVMFDYMVQATTTL